MASTGGRQDRGTSAVARLCSTIGVAAAITLGAWWEGTQRQSSRSAHISIGITIAVVFVGALSLGRHRQHAATRPWLAGAWSAIGSWRRQPKAAVVAVCIWVALGSAVVGWDLVSFLAQSHDLLHRAGHALSRRPSGLRARLGAHRRRLSWRPKRTSSMMAVTTGGVVWAVLAGGVVLWLVVTTLERRRHLVGLMAVVRWFLACWSGRLLLLAGWAAAGWHIFCQRP
jgi:hypothetical protein